MEIFLSLLINLPWSKDFWGVFFKTQKAVFFSTLVIIHDEHNNKNVLSGNEHRKPSYLICQFCFGTTSIKMELIRSDLIGSVTLKLILVLMIYVSNLYLKSVDHLCCRLAVIILRPKGFLPRENPDMQDTCFFKVML